MPQNPPRLYASGTCALIGQPNVGKSTLLNALLGQKLAITAPKPQTTRSRLVGVYLAEEPPTQIAFIDTPGMHRPTTKLGRVLVEEAKASIDQSDALVVIADASHCRRSRDHMADGDENLLRAIADEAKPVVVALNKIDKLPDKRQLLPIIEAYVSNSAVADVVPISALERTQLDEFVAAIRKHLPESEKYDEDFITDRPMRFLVAELVREAAIRNTRQEVPYAVAVTVDKYDESASPLHIAMTLVVERESQKGILIGKQGSMLKKIGSEARREIEALVGSQVYLQLWVKVIADWTQHPKYIRQLIFGETGNGS